MTDSETRLWLALADRVLGLAEVQREFSKFFLKELAALRSGEDAGTTEIHAELERARSEGYAKLSDLMACQESNDDQMRASVERLRATLQE